MSNNHTLDQFELKSFPQPAVISLEYPVLLCHGYGAIASLFKPSPLHDACLLLREHGITAFAPNVEPYARVEPRAQSWEKLIFDILDKTGSQKLNIIAHSMGGLDARYAISTLELDSVIASLTTLATPHHGTVLADLALKTPAPVKSRIGAFFDWLGDYIYPDTESDFLGPLEQLTPEYLEETFNPENPDAENVRYYSFGSAVGRGTDIPVSKLLTFQNRYIYESEGINDGFVSVQSAQWGQYIHSFELSHLEQMKMGIDESRIPEWESCWLQMAKNLQQDGF